MAFTEKRAQTINGKPNYRDILLMEFKRICGEAALGESVDSISDWDYNGHWAEVILYSTQAGRFNALKIDEAVK